MTNLVICIFLWLAVTFFSPAKLRAFFSILSGIVLAIFLYANQSVGGHSDTIHVPGEGEDHPGYELKVADLRTMAQAPDLNGVNQVEGLTELKAKGLNQYTHRDVDADFLLKLKNHPEFEDFRHGNKFFIIERVPAHVKNGVYVPESSGLRYLDTPFIQKARGDLNDKQNIIDEVRKIATEDMLERPLN